MHELYILLKFQKCILEDSVQVNPLLEQLLTLDLVNRLNVFLPNNKATWIFLVWEETWDTSSLSSGSISTCCSFYRRADKQGKIMRQDER